MICINGSEEQLVAFYNIVFCFQAFNYNIFDMMHLMDDMFVAVDQNRSF